MKSKEFDYWLSKVKPDNKIFVDLNLAIAKQVRHYLNTRNKSQKALAAVLEISESEISKWLSGLHNLTLEDIARMQDVLGEEIIMTDQMAKEKYGKPSGIDLDKLEAKFDEIFAKETPESLREWLENHRANQNKQDETK